MLLSELNFFYKDISDHKDEMDLFMTTMVIMPANSFPTKLVVVRAKVERELLEILKPRQLLKW